MSFSQPVHLQTKVECSGDVIILSFSDGKTRGEENRIAKELAALPDDIGPQHLFLDFAKITSIGSLELGTLICLHKKMRASGGRLTLFNLDYRVYEVFEVTRLHTLLEICRCDRQGGIASFAQTLEGTTKDENNERDQCNHGPANRPGSQRV
jgi:anti-anti-sigma factor